MENLQRIRAAENSLEIVQSPPDHPLMVVACETNFNGCFSIESEIHHHHTTSAPHQKAMTDWAIGEGMYATDAASLAERKPDKFDEAVFELLHMDPRRRDDLTNVGGWIVWFIANKATGVRRQWKKKRERYEKPKTRY